MMYLTKSRGEKKELLANREQEIVEIEEELVNRGERLEFILKERAALLERGKGNVDFDALNEKVDSLKEKLDLKNDFVETLKNENSKLQKENLELKKQLEKINKEKHT